MNAVLHYIKWPRMTTEDDFDCVFFVDHINPPLSQLDSSTVLYDSKIPCYCTFSKNVLIY